MTNHMWNLLLLCEVKLVADVIYMITQSALIAYLTCDAKLWFEKLLTGCVCVWNIKGANII